MHMTRTAILAVVSVMWGVVGIGCGGPQTSAPPEQLSASAPAEEMPVFEIDYSWPKPLPNQWVLGNIAGLAVDKNDHIWIIQRPLSLSGPDLFAQEDPPVAECCRAAPPIIEFDLAGTVVQAFGGPDPKNPKGRRHADGYEWPREHGLFIDDHGNVWTGSDETGAATVTKLTHDGKLIFQKGKFGEVHGSLDTENFGEPAGIFVDAQATEAYIADGYLNHRVIVIDADTGAFKRMWGAYGNEPEDAPVQYDPNGPPNEQFGNPVHCVHLSHDGLVYVCDRVNDRIQVFQKDGTFVKEGKVAPWTRGFGAVHDIAFSADLEQRFLYVADGANRKVWILRRDDLKVLGSFGHGGRGAGEFGVVHTLATDSKGNLYIGEVVGFNRLHKFAFKGLSKQGSSTATN